MDFRDTFNYYYRNNTTAETQAKFKIAKPPIMTNNLQKKEIRKKKFYMNNTTVPVFIPDRLTDDAYFNITTDAAATNNKIGNTLTISSLKYYIILRDSANTGACVVFLQQPANLNFGVPAPNTVIRDDIVYYQNKYYYYYDFTHFLSVVVNAFNLAQANLAVYGGPINPIFWMNQSGYFQFFVQNLAQWEFEISPSLAELFPFKSVQIDADRYRLVFNDIPATINGNTYNEVDASFYDTIFPFSQLVFRCDDGNLNPITFIDEGVLQTNAQAGLFESSILTYDIETNNFPAIYNFYKYVNENDTLWVNFYNDTDTRNHFTVSLYLRLKNNLLIPYTLKPKELCTFTVEVKYHDQ